MPKKVDHLTPFKPMGEVSLASKPLCVKVAPDIDELVRSLPNTSAWLRRVVTEAALKELLQPGQDSGSRGAA